MKLTLFFALLAGLAAAQHVEVPSTCTGSYKSGVDIVNYTVPYTYNQVLSIIGSYKNLTWSGNPPNTVKLNGSDNTVGTARSYIIPALPGVEIIETITKYEKPKDGPYDEVHTLALLTVNMTSGPPLKVYAPVDGTTVTPVCGGMASTFIFTVKYCANNVAAAKTLFQGAHTMDAQTVGKMLGGKVFKSCSALSASSTPSAAPPSMREARPSVEMFGASVSVAFAVFAVAALLM